MLNIFNENTTLSEAENTLDNIYQKDIAKQKLITSAPLSEDDVKKLSYLVHCVKDDKIEDYEKIKLSIVVLWAFQAYYGNFDHKKKYKDLINNLPQHHYRSYLDIVGSVFEEYAFATFGYNYYTAYGQAEIIDLHARLYKNLKKD